MNDPKYVLVDSVDFVTNKTHIFVSLFFFKVAKGRELSSQVLY